MMITRYDPFREALSLRRAMDQLFEQSFVPPSLMSGTSTAMVPMDICETANGYEVDVALPGVRPEDLEVMVDQNTLTIRGRFSHQNEHQSQMQEQMPRQSEMQPTQKQGGAKQPSGQQTQMQMPAAGQQMQQSQSSRAMRHQDGHNWLLQEIPTGSFERTITFPKTIDANRIETRYQDGILTILVPISEASHPKRISITAGQAQQIPMEAKKQ